MPLDPPADADETRKEVFGRVVCVYSHDDLGAALAPANDLPYAFQAAVVTRDLDTALHRWGHLDGTAKMVDESTLLRVAWMPFAGARAAGHGIGGIRCTIHEMQIESMVGWPSDALNRSRRQGPRRWPCRGGSARGPVLPRRQRPVADIPIPLPDAAA